MSLIGLGELLKKGLNIFKVRLVPLVAIGIVSSVIGLSVGSLTTKKWFNSVSATVQSANPDATVTQENFRDLLANLPPEQMSSAFLSPLLWVGALLAFVIGLWSQGALMLSAYPYESGSAGAPRELGAIAKEALGLMKKLFLIDLVLGLAGIVIGAAGALLIAAASLVSIPEWLVLIPVIALILFLGVYFGFAPLLLVVENQSVLGSLKRSRELVKNRWLATAARLGIMLLVALPCAVGLAMIPVVGAALGQVLIAPFVLTCVVALLESLKGSQASEAA